MHALDILWQTHWFVFNIPLWFLPCLFIIQSIDYLLFVSIKDPKISTFIVALWLVFASFVSPHIDSVWISQSLYAFPFLGAGYLIGKQRFIQLENYVQKLSTGYFVFAVFAFTLLCALWFYPVKSCMMLSKYPNGYLVYFAIALVCISSCFILSRILQSQKWLIWIGTNSLAIMCLHEPLKRILVVVSAKLLHMPNEEIRGSIILSLLLTAVIIAALVPVCIFINKRCKWVLGK